MHGIKIQGKLRAYLNTPLYLTILFAILAAAAFFWNIQAGMAASVIVAVYLIVILLMRTRLMRHIDTELMDAAALYNSLQKNLLANLDIPFGLLAPNGKIMWTNKKFFELFGKEKDFHKAINSVFPELTKERLLRDDAMEFTSEVAGRDYQLEVKRAYFGHEFAESGSFVQADESQQPYLLALYVFDTTDLTTAKKKLRDMQLVSGTIYIDNYDEVVESIDEVKRSMIMAIVDRRISRYFGNLGATVRKTDRDKYLIITNRRQLDTLIEKKFNILQEIKKVRLSNDMPITLSMGFGFMEDNPAKCNEYSRQAIELALGRGGDQAVLKMPNETMFFGGTTDRSDKYTRVKARVKALALREIMAGKDDFFIMGHSIADIDCLGSAIGIYCAARSLGKPAHIVLDTVNSTLKPFKNRFTVENGYPKDLFITSEQALATQTQHTALIIVDTNRPAHTESPELLARAKTVIVFDHHRLGEETIKGAVLSYIEPYASSTSEMIAEVLQYFAEDIRLSPAEADVIYGGILIDTNNFVTKTGVRTFEAAAYLRRNGADVSLVRKLMRNDIASYKARAEAIRHAELFEECFVISVLDGDAVSSPTIAGAQAANELLNISGIRASFVLTSYNGYIYISSRSIDEINVQRIMEIMGGGGHMNTAGAQLKGCTLEEAKGRLQETIRTLLEKGDIKI